MSRILCYKLKSSHDNVKNSPLGLSMILKPASSCNPREVKSLENPRACALHNIGYLTQLHKISLIFGLNLPTVINILLDLCLIKDYTCKKISKFD